METVQYATRWTMDHKKNVPFDLLNPGNEGRCQQNISKPMGYSNCNVKGGAFIANNAYINKSENQKIYHFISQKSNWWKKTGQTRENRPNPKLVERNKIREEIKSKQKHLKAVNWRAGFKKIIIIIKWTEWLHQ